MPVQKQNMEKMACVAFMSFGNCFISEAILIFSFSRVAAHDLDSLSFSATAKLLKHFVAKDVNACTEAKHGENGM